MEYAVTQADVNQAREEIVSFWLHTFPGWPEGKYDHFYAGNPRGHAGCWVAREEATGAVVGAVAVFPRRLLVGGEAHMAGLGGDLGVDSRHRRKGLAMELRKRMIAYRREAPLSFLYGTPNDRSARITVKAGYRIVGRTLRMVKVLRSKEYIRRVVRWGSLAYALGVPVDMALRAMSRESGHRLDPKYTIEMPEEFDERFDALWQRVSHEFPMIGERTAEFLRWRFTACPHKQFSTMALVEKESGAILGYVVYRRHADELHISDVLAINLDGALHDLLAQFMLLARRLRVAKVSLFYFGTDKVRDKFRQFGFALREHHRPLIVFVDDDSPLADLVRSEQNWYLFEGDNDT